MAPAKAKEAYDPRYNFSVTPQTSSQKSLFLCLRMTGNVAEAEDLSQEVFVQVFRKLDTFRGESAFTMWLYRLTVNHVLIHFRKDRRRRQQMTQGGELPVQVIKGRRV